MDLGLDRIPRLSRRTAAFLLVAGLHIAVFYAFVMGLGVNLSREIAPKLTVRVLDTPTRPREVTKLPPPSMTPWKFEVPPPEVPPSAHDPEETVRTPPPEPDQQPPRPSEPFRQTPPAVNRVMGGPGAGFPSTDEFYPSAAIHMGERGIATVRACVDGKGRLTSDPTIAESTGSPRLDEGAIRLAKAGSGHYRATTEDGRPVNSCYSFRIRFDLKN
jgi:protein TonB